MKILEQTDIQLNDSQLQSLLHCIHKVEIIILRKCHITNKSVEKMVEQIMKTQDTVKYLTEHRNEKLSSRLNVFIRVNQQNFAKTFFFFTCQINSISLR